MKVLIAAVLLCFATLLQASPLNELYHAMPLLICQDETYRECQGADSVEACALGAKAFRESCSNDSSIDSVEALRESMACIVLNHNGANSVEALEARCGGMNINLTKARDKVSKMDPDKVEQLLQ